MNKIEPQQTGLSTPAPTLANIAYGKHERQVLDFWMAETKVPAPALLYIHGGGWLSCDKSAINVSYDVQGLLDAGISVISISYRYVPQTIIEDEASRPAPVSAKTVASEDPPVAPTLYDAARALQFVRSRAADWRIDKARIAVSGGSAGACSSLWLAFHPDLAEPHSADPVSRESSRPWCAAVEGAQTTLDPLQMKQWTPNSRYGGHAFGFAWNANLPDAEFEAFLANRETVLPWIERFSPYSLASAGAPPVYLCYSDGAPAFGQESEDPTHASNFGALLKEKLDTTGSQCEFVYPGATDVVHESMREYLIDMLRADRGTTTTR